MVGENPSCYGILPLWTVNGLSIVCWVSSLVSWPTVHLASIPGLLQLMLINTYWSYWFWWWWRCRSTKINAHDADQIFSILFNESKYWSLPIIAGWSGIDFYWVVFWINSTIKKMALISIDWHCTLIREVLIDISSLPKLNNPCIVVTDAPCIFSGTCHA